MVLSLANLLKHVNLSTLGLKKKKMLQKRTTYHLQLNTLPTNIKSPMVENYKVDFQHQVAYLVFLDMLQLMKM